MSTRRLRQPSARWPFWLLVAAWWCANAPQAATFEMMLWLKGAAYFSHQADLKMEVASILHGGSAVAGRTAGQNLRESPPPAVPIAKPLAVKRVDLFLPGKNLFAQAAFAGEAIALTDHPVPERPTARPRLRPPRSA